MGIGHGNGHGHGRGLGDCFSCIKYLLFAFNFLFWLLGCTLIGVGVWVRMDPMFHPYIDTHDVFNHIHLGAYILLGVGLVVMVIGFLGCCGTIQESQCLLILFFLSLFAIFGVLLAAGIWAIVRKDTVREALDEVIMQHVSHYYQSNKSRRFMDDLQTQWRCCGGQRGLLDYEGGEFPPTCEGYVGMGCTDRVLTFLADKFIIIAGCASGVGVVMIMGMLFSLLMCCAIRDL